MGTFNAQESGCYVVFFSNFKVVLQFLLGSISLISFPLRSKEKGEGRGDDGMLGAGKGEMEKGSREEKGKEEEGRGRRGRGEGEGIPNRK